MAIDNTRHIQRQELIDVLKMLLLEDKDMKQNLTGPSDAQIEAAINKAIAEGKIAAYDDTEIRDRLKGISKVRTGINIFDKENLPYTANAQLSDSGVVQVNESWNSGLSDFIYIDKSKSKTRRVTSTPSLWVCEYKEDGTFIKKIKNFNSSNPVTLDDETVKIRVMYYTGWTDVMIYQSDEIMTYEPYKKEEYIVATVDIPTDTELLEKGVPADAYTVGKLLSDKEFEELEITNYMLLPHKT